MTLPDLPFEEEAHINFYNADIDFELSNAELLINWLKGTVVEEGQHLHFLNFIFCTDEYLYKVNVAYLNHHTYTDVITFPYSEVAIEGDIFISIDRVRENARGLQLDFDEELHRVMIHGTLHLLGYMDKNSKDKQLMTQMEDKYLSQLHGMMPNP